MEHILDIFYQRLAPGAKIRGRWQGGRAHINLSPFLPYDFRNVAVGREQHEYDTVTMSQAHAERLAANHSHDLCEVLS